MGNNSELVGFIHLSLLSTYYMGQALCWVLGHIRKTYATLPLGRHITRQLQHGVIRVVMEVYTGS